MTWVLVAYGTKRGSTREVAESIGTTLREHGLEVEIAPAGRVKDIGRYGGIVLGGALYSGRWHRDARRFLRRHRKTLASLPVAAFGIGPRQNEEAAFERARGQLDRALAKAPDVRPVSVAVFGGADRKKGVDLRDWTQIRAWAEELDAVFEQAWSATIAE